MQKKKRQQQQQVERKLQQLSLTTRSTPTWTQLKNLTRQATEIAQQRFPSPTPEIIFLAILSILAVQAPAVQTEAYWAYVPRPPLLHPVGWFDPEGYKVLTNNSEMIGGFQDSDERPSSSHHVTFEGRADSLPVCLALQGTAPKGCLTLSYRTFLTDSPDKVNQPGKTGNSRWIWETQILSLGFPTYNETFEKVSFMPLASCIKEYRDINQFWDSSISPLPTWLKCGFSNSASKFFPRGTSLQIWDFSASSGDKQYNEYLKNNADKFHKYSPKDSSGKQITRWFSPGYVEPVWVARDTSRQTMKQHPGLFRLAAASSMILQKRPNETKPTPYALRACVSYPFAMLLGKPAHVNITKLNSTSYMVKCHSCVLTNCISPKKRNGLKILLLVKRPAFVMMPVDLKDSPWYDDSALQVLKNLHALIRPKRFVAALILGITALISIITTFAIATTALVQEIHTAHFVNDLNKNISFALSEQVVIDKKLEAKINVLEEVVLALGQDIVNIRRQLETNCHKEFKSICVTPLPYNTSEPWEKIKNHLQGVWKDTDITHDLMALQKDISAMSQAHLKMGSLKTLTRDLEADMKALSPVDWLQYIIFIAVLGLLVFLVILLFPCIFRLLSRSISQVQKDIYAFRLKNKKPGTATPTTVSPV